MVTYSQMELFANLPTGNGVGIVAVWCVRVGMEGESSSLANGLIEKSVSKGTVQAPFWSLSMDDA